jgi:hypothetical protein
MAGRSQRWAAAMMILWVLGLIAAAPYAPLLASSPKKACCRTKARHKCCRTPKAGEVAVAAPKSCPGSCCFGFVLSGSGAGGVAPRAARLVAHFWLHGRVPAAAERVVAAPVQPPQFERPPPVLL